MPSMEVITSIATTVISGLLLAVLVGLFRIVSRFAVVESKLTRAFEDMGDFKHNQRALTQTVHELGSDLRAHIGHEELLIEAATAIMGNPDIRSIFRRRRTDIASEG